MERQQFAHSKSFWAGIRIEIIFPLWRQCRNWLFFTTTKISTCQSLVVLYQTWPTFSRTNLLIHNFYPLTEADRERLAKTQEDVVRGPSIVFTRKAVVYETFIRKATIKCKPVVGIHSNQLYPYSMSKPMPAGLYTRWDLDPQTSRYTPRQNKTSSFENMVRPYFQRTRPDCKIESFYTTGREEKMTASVMIFLFSLQYCVWSHGLLLSHLSLSRGSTFSHWGSYRTW